MIAPKKKVISMPVATTFSLKMERNPGNFRFSSDFFGSPIRFASFDTRKMPNIC